MMFFPATVTAREAFFSFLPPQSGQGTELMTSWISSRIQAELVSRKRRSRLLTIPSKVVLYLPVPVSYTHLLAISSSLVLS